MSSTSAALHDPSSCRVGAQWGCLCEMGDPLGYHVGVYVHALLPRTLEEWYRGTWGGLRLIVCISECDPICVLNVDVESFSLYVHKHGYSSVFYLLMSTIWQSVLATLYCSITPTPNMLSDEIIEWESAVSTVHMPDIKSHHYEVRGREPGPLWAPDGPNDLIMGWHV